MRYRIKHVIEYALLRAVSGLLRTLPYRAALALGWILAATGHWVIGFRRGEARRRIRSVLGPETGEDAIRRAAWISFRNLCFNAVELVRLPRLSRAWIERHMDDSAVNPAREHLAGKRGGALFAVPHAGNWDLAGVALHLQGMPIFFIARRQKNPLTDAYLNRMRAATGARTILNDEKVLRQAIRNLRDGGVLAILPDVRARTHAHAVRFLKGDANWGGGAGLLAQAARVPVFPFIVVRDGWARHRIIGYPPLEPDPRLDKTADRQRILQALADLYTAFIVRHPEQYFWYNKRWVLDPLNPATAGEHREADRG